MAQSVADLRPYLNTQDYSKKMFKEQYVNEMKMYNRLGGKDGRRKRVTIIDLLHNAIEDEIKDLKSKSLYACLYRDCIWGTKKEIRHPTHH